MRHLVQKKYKSEKAELPFPGFYSEMNSYSEMSENLSEYYHTENSGDFRINGLF